MPVPETAKPAIPYPGNKTDQSAQKNSRPPSRLLQRTTHPFLFFFSAHLLPAVSEIPKGPAGRHHPAAMPLRPWRARQTSRIRRRRARSSSSALTMRVRGAAGMEAHHGAIHGALLLIPSGALRGEHGGLSSRRRGRADAGEAPHLAVHLVRDGTVEDLLAQLPEDGAGKPGVAAGRVLRADALAAQLVREVLEPALCAEIVEDRGRLAADGAAHDELVGVPPQELDVQQPREEYVDQRAVLLLVCGQLAAPQHFD